MHRHESEYLQQEQLALAAPMIEEFANFIELLEQSNFSTEQKSKLGELLFTYHDRFNDVVETLKNVQRNREEVNLSFDSIGPSMDALVDVIETITTGNFNALETQRNQSTRIFTLTLVFTAILLTVLMFFMGRSITNPLQRLQTTVQQVNQGDISPCAYATTRRNRHPRECV